MSQEILLGFGLKVKNNGKDSYCPTSKTLLPSGQTVSIQYDSKDEKALAIRNFGQLNALAKETIFEFSDLTFTPGTGGSGGDYNFLVQELDLLAIADKVQSVISITPDVSNSLSGTNINGVVQPDAESTLSAYFRAVTGKFSITVDTTLSESAILEILDTEPTQKKTFAEGGQDPEFLGIGIVAQGTGLIILIGNLFTGTGLSVSITPTSDQETITFLLKDESIEIYNKGVQLGKFNHDGNLGTYFHTLPETEMVNANLLRFNLSEAFVSLDYKLPDDAKDGDIYHLTRAGYLFNQELLINDYITIHSNKSNILISRLPKEIESKPTKIMIPVTRYHQSAGEDNMLQAYYDTELKNVLVVGMFYLTETITNEDTRVFELDLTELELLGYPQFTRSYNFYYYNRNGVFYLYGSYDSALNLYTVRVEHSEAPNQYAQCTIPQTLVLS